MKIQLLYIYFTVYLALIISFTQKKYTPQQSANSPKISAKRLIIRFAGELDFRRTFADLQFIANKKEQDKYVSKQEKSNPVLQSPVDEFMKERFEKLGLIKGDELQLTKFKYDTLTSFHIPDISGEKINIQFDFIPGRISNHKIVASLMQDSAQTNIDITMQDLKYALLNIIPGGNKEIVLLNEWYISNGYNFDLLVYEIEN